MALEEFRDWKVVALAGGVGGAKLAHGLAQILPAEKLTVVVNVADDFELYGLTVCPDLDTVMYTLAGMASRATGWGIEGDTFHCMESLARLGAPAWFRMGDRDLATHLARTRWLWDGAALTEVTRRLCASLGVTQKILPCTDDLLRTIVETDEGDLEFQDYFVRRRCEPAVRGFQLRGLPAAFASREFLEALDAADAIVLCPSNPLVSLGPILALDGIREKVAAKPSAAVTPLIGGQAVKGPLAKMLRELGREPTAVEAARDLRGSARGFVLDRNDSQLAADIETLGFHVALADTLMTDDAGRKNLALNVLRFIQTDRAE